MSATSSRGRQEGDGNSSDSESGSDAHRVFTIKKRPVRFYLLKADRHRTYGLSSGAAAALSQKILDHGGELVPGEESEPDTIIVKREGLDDYRQKYNLSKTVFAEPPEFVQICIDSRKYKHAPVLKKGMGGRVFSGSGRSYVTYSRLDSLSVYLNRSIQTNRRVAFTPEDDYRLCKYLAQVVPDKAAGGRMGNNIYIELVMSTLPEFQWAKRHPWQAWRERYKTRQDLLDPIIDELVKQFPPREDGKGQYHLDRRFSRRARLRQHLAQSGDEAEEAEGLDRWEEEEEGEEVEVVEVLAPERGRKRTEIREESVERGRHAQVRTHKRSRHTDVGARRPSSTERGRTSRRTQSDAYFAAHRRVSPTTEQIDARDFPVQSIERRGRLHGGARGGTPDFDQLIPFETMPEQDEYYFENRGPGPEDAGPSGTQRTPVPTSPPPPPPTAVPAKGRPAPRPVYRARSPAPVMSSQATLAGPVSTQRHSGPSNVSEDDVEILAGPEPTFPMSSQVTLVGPVPTQLRPDRAVTHSKEARRQPVKAIQVDVAEGQNEAEPVPPSQSTPRKAARKKPGRRRIHVVEDPRIGQDEPYHNTRARSRSRPPEAAFEIQPRRPAARRGKPAAPEPVEAEPEGRVQMYAIREEKEAVDGPDRENRERLEEPEIGAVHAMEVDPPVGGTYEDEENVEDMLAVAESAPQSGAPSAIVQQSPKEELDSDDQRVEQSLFVAVSAHTLSRPVSRDASSNVHLSRTTYQPLTLDDEDEQDEVILARLRGDTPASRSRLSFSELPLAPTPADRSRQHISITALSPASGLIRRTNLTTPAARQPPTRGTPSGSSVSEFDTVPMPGTRASAEKQRLREETRRAPYNPPEGTRAARMATRSGALFGRF
ncbi:hypothetical protein OBBRIDRAFT_312276 [Obba rivulosa]|uniref:TERF2-interacting telomeric protein 1 Myb domain-containing protein n=1 Tax=Obba rivulosa TaxID=1052685 RepID=A0A8E2DK64_9APHY|nr:hypothetical protein OBBRIDRAFT_312276 [Obba rivulosa]